MSDLLASLWVPEKESNEFILEGLKQASSAATQLSRVQKSEVWHDISKLLDEIHNKCSDLYRRRSFSRTEILQQLNEREALIKREVEAGRLPPVKIQ